MKIVVVSPHRDDAAFSLSLAIESWLREGKKVVLLNCFIRSEYAPYSDALSVHANDRMSYVTALRRQEDQAWQRQQGRGLECVELNLKDAPLRLRCSVDEVCSMEVRDSDKALPKIRGALEALLPAALVLPLAIGGHVDHLAARAAALSLCTDDRPVAFYEDLPYAARPLAAEKIEKEVEQFGLDLAPVYAGSSRDPQAAEERKRRLILCYDSQINSEQTTMISVFGARYGGRERLWANAPWRSLFERSDSKESASTSESGVAS